MANRIVRVEFDSEFNTFLFTPSSLGVERSDTVEFRRGGGDFSGANITVQNFSSTYYTNTSNVTVPAGTGTGPRKTIRSTAPIGGNAGVSFHANGRSAGYTIRILDTPDTTPNAFNLADKTNQDPNSQIEVGFEVVSGVNRDITVNISGASSARVSLNGGPKQSTVSPVNNGSQLRFTVTTPPGYGQSYTLTVTAGGLTETVTVSNRAFPLVDQVINLGINSGLLRLKNDIADFFGQNSPVRFSDYYRGGSFVPSISQNSAISTSGLLKMSQFYGSATAFYFVRPPGGKEGEANTITSPQTVALNWNKDVDWELGFGDNLEQNAEYRYGVVQDASNPAGLQIFPSTFFSWSQSNTYLGLRVDAGQGTEAIYSGTLTVYARNRFDTSIAIQRSVPFYIGIYGP